MFEQVGRFLVRRCRTWSFFLFLTAPFCFAMLFLAFRFSSLRDLEEEYRRAELIERSALKQRARKGFFLGRYGDCDPYFISQELEKMELLSQRKEELRKKIEHPACWNRAALKSELSDCEQPQNRLSFLEEAFRTSKSGAVKETEEKLRNPIKIEIRDLERILSVIEDVSIGEFSPNERSPQMLIRDFSLTRKENDLYELDLSLLKREFSYD